MDFLVFLTIMGLTESVFGLSLDSIKAVMESESSGKVLSLLLDEQAKLLCDEREFHGKNKKVLKKNRRLLLFGSLMAIPQFTLLALRQSIAYAGTAPKMSNKKPLYPMFSRI